MTQFLDLPFEVQGVIANFAEGKDRLMYLSTYKKLYEENQTAFYEGILQILTKRGSERHVRALSIAKEPPTKEIPRIEKIKSAIVFLFGDGPITALYMDNFPFQKDPGLTQEIIRNCWLPGPIGTPEPYLSFKLEDINPALRLNCLRLLSENKLQVEELYLEFRAPLDQDTLSELTAMVAHNKSVKTLTLCFKEWPDTLNAGCFEKSQVTKAKLGNIPSEEESKFRALLKDRYSFENSSMYGYPTLIIEKISA